MIRKYMRLLQLNDKQLKQINELRKVCNLDTLVQKDKMGRCMR